MDELEVLDDAGEPRSGSMPLSWFDVDDDLVGSRLPGISLSRILMSLSWDLSVKFCSVSSSRTLSNCT
jgi:hypothetical protein